MGTEAPTPVVIPIHFAPKKAPCPRCGRAGRRKRTFTRMVRTDANKAVAYLELTGGEYGARCDLKKVRYEWRRRTLVRFVILTLDRIWKEQTATRSAAAAASPEPGSGKAKGKTGKRGRAA